MKIRLFENTQTDSVGNELSPTQIQFFKNSKVRDSQNRLLVCYHGTPTPGFKEFSPSNSNSQFGRYKFNTHNVNYFTTDLQAASSYTEMGYENNGNVYYCYVNIENPFIVDNQSLSEIKSSFNIKDNRLRDKQVSILERIYNKFAHEYLDEDNLDELNTWFSYLNCEIIENGDYYDLIAKGNNSAFGSDSTITYVEDLEELFTDVWEEIEEYLIGDYDDYLLNTDMIVKLVLYMNKEEGTNYDGIIIEDIFDSKNMIGENGTDIITLKSSNQIKLISNISPSLSNRIDESK